MFLGHCPSKFDLDKYFYRGQIDKDTSNRFYILNKNIAVILSTKPELKCSFLIELSPPLQFFIRSLDLKLDIYKRFFSVNKMQLFWLLVSLIENCKT